MASPLPPHAASLRLNIAANYAGQLYAALIGILMVPAYLHWLGAETYGLIAFFTLLHLWAQLLDAGLTATISRQAARFGGGAISAHSFRSLLRVFEYLFLALGVLLVAGLSTTADSMAAAWLRAEQLPRATVTDALRLMGLAVGLRWLATLYRGVLLGLERQVWLNAFTCLIVTLRFVAAVPVTLAWEGSVQAFFGFQVIVAALELAGLQWAAYRAAPAPEALRLASAWPLFRSTWHFSAWAAVAAIVWVVMSQVDKLIMSIQLSLAEYGFFTAAVSAASAVTILALALSQALLPRLTRVAAQGDEAQMRTTYRGMSRMGAAVGVPLALTLALQAEAILFAWTGDRALASRQGGVLAFYAIGNAFMLLAIFPYVLQYALGQLRLHVLGNVLFASVMVPLLFLTAGRYGAMGAAWTWAGIQAAFFVTWTPLVHRRLVPGLHRPWLLRDVAAVATAPMVLAILFVALDLPEPQGRLEALVRISATLLVLLASGLAGMGAVQARWRTFTVRRSEAARRSQAR